MNKSSNACRECSFQSFIGWQLRVGVLLAIALALVGIVVLLMKNDAALPNLSQFSAAVSVCGSFANLWAGLVAGEATAVMQLAVAVLIATPLLRIACSLVAFLLEHDWLYVAITSLVALIIGSTIVLGVGH